jgi:molybdopterin converting factor small subunit
MKELPTQVEELNKKFFYSLIINICLGETYNKALPTHAEELNNNDIIAIIAIVTFNILKKK